MTSPCQPWINTADLIACGCPDDISQATLDNVMEIATDVIYGLSGRKWGAGFSFNPKTAVFCTATRRPCAIGIGCRCNSSSLFPPIAQRPCGCSAIPTLELPHLTVQAITQVRIDGAVLAASAYRLDPPNKLVRIDGMAWPCCQDLTGNPATDPDTWDVSYTYGETPPNAAVMNTAILATELAKGCTGSKCRLPAGAVNVTQRGITYSFDVVEGRTGLYEIDQWLMAVNPQKAKAPVGIIAADDQVYN